MLNLDTQLQSLQDKLQQLLKLYQALQKENQHLKRELALHQAALENKNFRLNQLEQQVDVLQVSAKTQTVEEKKALEQRVDQYLKEIDKCLALLNA
jgi:chromosome segregation ATPase